MGSKYIISSWSFAESLPTPNEATRLDMATPSWFHCQRDSAELFTWLEQQLIPQALIGSVAKFCRSTSVLIFRYN